MKKYILYILVVAFFFGISSCQKKEIAIAFEENIKIRMFENVDSVKRTLNLRCYTEKKFLCSNYEIETTHTVTDNKITINFIKILTSSFCLTAAGPAYTTIQLNGLSNKIYDLELNFGTSKVSGQFNVTANSFVATIPAQTQVQFENQDLKRVPDNTIYGKIHYSSSSLNLIGQKFIDTLQLYGATPILYQPGDYGEFQIEANGQIKQTQDAGYSFTRYYIFNYTNNALLLKNLVRRFGVNYPNQLFITMYTTKGEKFYSWIP